MRQRFVQVLRSDERNEEVDSLSARFWSRAKPLPARASHHAEVIDFAQWMRARRDDARR